MERLKAMTHRQGQRAMGTSADNFNNPTVFHGFHFLLTGQEGPHIDIIQTKKPTSSTNIGVLKQILVH